MKDRLPTHAGRVQLTPVTGNTYDLTMADEPTEQGTPLNKATLLSDAAAAAVWPVSAPADPTPSEAFIQLAGLRPIKLCDYTNTASITSSGLTFSLTDDIENYTKLDIWIVSNTAPSTSRVLYVDVGNAVNADNRIGSADLRTSEAPNPIHFETLVLDNSSAGHLVLSDPSRKYRSSEYPDPNVAYSGSGKLEGKNITLSVSTSSVSANNLRVVIIGNKIL